MIIFSMLFLLGAANIISTIFASFALDILISCTGRFIVLGSILHSFPFWRLSIIYMPQSSTHYRLHSLSFLRFNLQPSSPNSSPSVMLLLSLRLCLLRDRLYIRDTSFLYSAVSRYSSYRPIPDQRSFIGYQSSVTVLTVLVSRVLSARPFGTYDRSCFDFS